MSKTRSCTDSNVDTGFDITGNWGIAKQRAKDDVAAICDQYPPDVLQRLFEALTLQHYRELSK